MARRHTVSAILLAWWKGVRDKSRIRPLFTSGLLIIRHPRHAEALGFVASSWPTSSPMLVHVYLDHKYRGLGYGAAAAGIFIRYLFESFHTSKLVFEVPGWDLSGARLMSSLRQFLLEGVRLKQLSLGGDAYDLYEFGLSREDFQLLRETPLWPRLVGPSEFRSNNSLLPADAGGNTYKDEADKGRIRATWYARLLASSDNSSAPPRCFWRFAASTTR